MVAVRATLLSALACSAYASQVDASLRGNVNVESSGLVHSLSFSHKLRVCNAYPFEKALDVYRGDTEKFTSAPMPYKSCQDFATPLKAGDKLDFKAGETSAGSFSVADLPNSDGVLLLVVHRHDTKSTSVSFESHVFSNQQVAQVAIIDTYKGHKKGTAFIKDHDVARKVNERRKQVRNEELRYNSVVAVSPGNYNIVLDDDLQKEVSRMGLVVLDGESYVVMRTGLEAESGASYPEELVVFPQSDPTLLPKSGACKPPSHVLATLSALLMTAAFGLTA